MFALFSPHGGEVVATIPPKLNVQLDDVVTIAEVGSKKVQHKNVYKITRVRPDLTWGDVINNL